MANSNVLLIANNGVYVPNLPSVAVVAGDTVSFATSDGSAVLLFFSSDAASVLSPAPGNSFQLAAGATASFTFTSSASGAYSVYFGASGDSAPSSFPTQVSQNLMLEISDSGGGSSFSGPHNVIVQGS